MAEVAVGAVQPSGSRVMQTSMSFVATFRRVGERANRYESGAASGKRRGLRPRSRLGAADGIEEQRNHGVRLAHMVDVYADRPW